MRKYKIELKWAAIFIVAMLLWMFLERVVGLHGEHIEKHPVYTNLFAIPAILIYTFALIDKRDNFYGGKMTYLQGLYTGFIITFIVTLLSPAVQYVSTSVISPEYFSNVIEYSVSSGKMTRDQAMDYFNTRNYIMQGMIFTPVIGIITSVVVALFTRRKNSGREE